MNRAELRKLIRGISVAIPTAFDNDMRLDLPTMADLTRWWVESGLGTDYAPLKVAAAWGEGPDLSDDEWPQLLRTVVDAAGPDAVVMCALKEKSTMHTIEDAKRAQDLGAIGLQIELPYNHHPNQDDYVRHFTTISDNIDIGIMIYNTFWFGAPPIEAETILRMKDTEHVVAVKWNANREGLDYDDMRKFSADFNVIGNGQGVRCVQNGGAGFVSASAPAYPAYDLKVWSLIQEERYDEASEMETKFRDAMGDWRKRTTERSGGYRQAKGIMAVMGHPVGPPRLPTLPMDDAELTELAEILKGLGWPVPEKTAVAL